MSSKASNNDSRKKRKVRIPNNWIPVKHKVLEEIFAKGLLRKREIQVVAVIIRDSWGYRAITKNGNWSKDSLKNEDFVKRTGMAKSHISKILRELIESKVISEDHGKYSFNEHFQTWKRKRVTKKVTARSYQKSNSKSVKSGPLGDREMGRQPNSYQKGNNAVAKKVTFSEEDEPSEINSAVLKKKEIKKEKEMGQTTSPSSAQPSTSPNIRKLIALYCEKYTQRFGQKPIITHKKDGAIAKRLLKNKNLEELDRLLDQFFKSKWDFLNEKGSYSFGLFGSATVINRLQKELWEEVEKDEWGNPISQEEGNEVSRLQIRRTGNRRS